MATATTLTSRSIHSLVHKQASQVPNAHPPGSEIDSQRNPEPLIIRLPYPTIKRIPVPSTSSWHFSPKAPPSEPQHRLVPGPTPIPLAGFVSNWSFSINVLAASRTMAHGKNCRSLRNGMLRNGATRRDLWRWKPRLKRGSWTWMRGRSVPSSKPRPLKPEKDRWKGEISEGCCYSVMSFVYNCSTTLKNESKSTP
ncbi:hypothetical protein BJ508DRAFT_338958, partial [Ascobolus immersus RN42]